MTGGFLKLEGTPNIHDRKELKIVIEASSN